MGIILAFMSAIFASISFLMLQTFQSKFLASTLTSVAGSALAIGGLVGMNSKALNSFALKALSPDDLLKLAAYGLFAWIA